MSLIPSEKPQYERPPCESALREAPVPEPCDEGIAHAGAGPRRRSSSKVWACAGCGITAEVLAHGKLKECSTCRSVRYCGRACQKADWPAHKATCKRLQAARGRSTCFPHPLAAEE